MSERGVLLDTCALIWLASGARLRADALGAIDEAAAKNAAHVSVAAAWEIGLIASRGRPALDFVPDAKSWFARFLARPGVVLAPLTPAIAIDSSLLPSGCHGDPGDRLLIATARDAGLPIITRDRKILDYADAGHVEAIAC